MFLGRAGGQGGASHALLQLGPEDSKRVALGATAAIVVLAVLFVIFGRVSSGARGCSGIIFAQQRYGCFSALALQSGNDSLCYGIGATAQRDSCIIAVAKSTGNVSTCSAIGGAGKDYTYCVLTVGSGYSTSGYCSMLGEPDRSSCLYAFAQRGGFSDTAICGQIENAIYSGVCGSMVDFASAYKSFNSSGCARLPNSNDTRLMQAITTYGTENTTYAFVSAMGYEFLNITPRDYCYIRIANATMNNSACSLTSGGAATSVCLAVSSPHNTAVATVNSTASCSGLPSYLSDACAYGILIQNAVATKNVSVCESMQNSQYEYSCLEALAGKYRNASYCGYIADATIRENCTLSYS